MDTVVMLSNNSWDVSAGVIIAREAGALVLDANGAQHSMDSTATVGVTPGLRDELMTIVSTKTA
jgi:myo-inositol-1(or 4)-monophosphatase